MAINKRRPLQPIFDEKKQFGAIDVGNSPPTIVEYCDDFELPDGPLGPDWVQQGGIVISGGAMARSGTSRWAQFQNPLPSPDMYVEYDDENVSAHLAMAAVRLTISTDPTPLLTGYFGGYYPSYSSHPNGEWQILRNVNTNAASWAPPGALATASTPDPAGPITVRFTATTDSNGDVVLNLYQVVGGVPLLRLTHTDSSLSKITTGNLCGLTPGTDPIHTSTPCKIANFCCGS